jgi:hypothetical protein
MVFQLPQFWGVVGDSFQILLCLLVFGFIFKTRAIQKKYPGFNIKNETGKSFNTHIFNLTVEQQVNQAFANILEAIAEERNGLERLLGLRPLKHEADHISMVPANRQLPKSYSNYRASDDRIGRAGRDDNVRKLAAKGLSVRKISRGLNIPISEVELILSLRDNEIGGRIFPK